VCPRASGKASKKAREFSVSYSFFAGMVPFTILQKMHAMESIVKCMLNLL
jgi:hypothetical protein